MKKSTKAKWIILIIVGVFVLLSAGFGIYVSDYYKCDDSVNQYYNQSTSVQIKDIEEGIFIDGPSNEKALIFYPGAKVEYKAYIPLLYQLAENGVDVFLIKMPCNLAIFGMDRADNVIEKYGYDEWYMAGHSLGGAMAASYCTDNMDKIKGLVLLAAYPTKNLKQNDFWVVSIYGSEDGVLNKDKLEQGRQYMPDKYEEVCISGGNHAQFGNYGIQKADGAANISAKQQQEQTVEAVLKMINENDD